ncbi:helix-turn-helix domain-containing protein [Chitinophagaceae bacterium LB-8]|uniref:Helix-turn-helix domain-containing protein n=1 Tax=Paraflavisolibacter caeni TaxID=2982496 RepID=A0A9X2XPV9_9BACT|nr:helix-turn-helix domain-containing protein [Paraflavisolibacter caeni]MCU7552313.1 helix-turn-helix domain-containing protein [Paraflavisolibacter caeni]
MKKKNFFSYLLSLLGEKRRIKNIEVRLGGESIDELKCRLESLMERERPYLRGGYHIKELADDLQIPVYKLSAFINQVYGMRFTDYMNKFRTKYCEELMKTDLSATSNLKELAYKCGFSNRNSFTAAFKKFTGQKPSVYLRRLLIFSGWFLFHFNQLLPI